MSASAMSVRAATADAVAPVAMAPAVVPVVRGGFGYGPGAQGGAGGDGGAGGSYVNRLTPAMVVLVVSVVLPR